MKRFIFISFILLFLASCGKTNETKSSTHKIYTTIYPIHFLVTELVHDDIKVVTVYPPGVDAHTYEPTIREMIDIASGDAFFYLGEELETFTNKAKSALKNSDVSFIEIGKYEGIFSSDSVDADPHFWFDPLRMIIAANMISEQLSELYPEDKQVFQENLNELTKDLTTLDEQFAKSLAKTDKREIIVSHGAYKYWEERYGIRQIPISGITATDEPSQKELTNLIQSAKEKNISYVLFEQNATNKIAEIIQEELDAKRLFIHNLEVLVDDDIENEENYFSLMKHNLQQLEKALQ